MTQRRAKVARSEEYVGWRQQQIFFSYVLTEHRRLEVIDWLPALSQSLAGAGPRDQQRAYNWLAGAVETAETRKGPALLSFDLGLPLGAEKAFGESPALLPSFEASS